MLSERLKNETADVHQQLERTLIPVLKNMRQQEEYVRLLKTFYSFYLPIEQKLDLHLGGQVVPQYNERRKVSMLLDDMYCFTHDVSAPLCENIPAINNLHQAMGVMYVLEGSTLGGQVISRMLIKNLELADDECVGFFSGYKDATDEMWASFKNTLDSCASGKEEEDIVVAAAFDTFTLFKQWIDVNIPALTAS